jgi:alkanesulfonate monooxygenase SsuD/methylene tetrahydromethanopterin reductase-like flavin-dependent oxidoreductase (luciferase family)
MDFSAMVLALYVDADDSPQEDERILGLAVEQSLLAGNLGLNPWYTEHHFRGPWHSAPMQFAAFVAARLPEEVFLGFGVLSVPFYHPVRLVEQMNLLDQLTHGRVLFGLGSGFPGVEPASAGLSEEHHGSGRATREALEIMERLWDYRTGDEPYAFDTGRYSGRIVKRVMPSAYRHRRPKIIRTARNDLALIDAASRGWPVFLGTFGTDLGTQVATYRRELEAARHPSAVVEECLRWSTVDWLSVLVAPTDAEAAELFEEARAERLETRRRFLDRHASQVHGPAIATGPGGPTPADFAQGRDMLNTIAGSPDTVSREVQKLADLGVNHLLLRFLGEWTGATRPIIEQSMQLFSEHVMPRFARLDRASVA